MTDRTHKFTTNTRKIGQHGELTWGGENDWNNEIKDSDGVIVVDGQVSPSKIPTDGLVSYWTFNGDYLDQVNQYDGVASDGVEFAIDTQRGTVADFNGVDGKVTVGQPKLQDEAITVSAWASADRFGDGNGHEAQLVQVPQTDSVVLQATDNGQWGARIYDSSEGTNYRTVAPGEIGTWVHLVLTFDGGTLRLYVDGVQEDSTTVPPTINTTNTDEWVIGSHTTAPRYYAGRMGDVAVYNWALDDTTVKELHTATK